MTIFDMWMIMIVSRCNWDGIGNFGMKIILLYLFYFWVSRLHVFGLHVLYIHIKFRVFTTHSWIECVMKLDFRVLPLFNHYLEISLYRYRIFVAFDVEGWAN